MKRIFIFVLKLLALFSLVIYPRFISTRIKLICRKIYTYRKASLFKNFGKSLIMGPFTLLRGEKYIEIGDNVTIGKNITLTAFHSRLISNQTFNPEIIIGDGCVIGDYSHITCINKITIGKNLLTGKNILITDNSHGKFQYEELNIPPMERPIYSKGEVNIGNNVWIGDKASILSGVKIGDGCIIASNTVVTKDIPSYSLVAGIPGQIIKSIP